TRGSGRIFGHDLVADADLVRERVGLLAHAPGLYPDLTAAENLAFAQRMCGESVDRACIDAALERVDMLPHADERVRFFSSGMTRRVALARFLLRRHDLLLLDEPYASFDAEGIALLNTLLLEARARGAAVIIATHDPVRARAACDRMVRIEEGQLVELADAQVLEVAT
ncbi:MAG TPA: ATP-binding cassette domain-containing protein, partial [Gemmatimonadaceae bacterium]|nr:ATP-binding cassette domain-containing protein [Gemmatimonadaceae bacterium]